MRISRYSDRLGLAWFKRGLAPFIFGSERAVCRFLLHTILGLHSQLIETVLGLLN